MVSYFHLYICIKSARVQGYFELRTRTGLSVRFLVITIGSSQA